MRPVLAALVLSTLLAACSRSIPEVALASPEAVPLHPSPAPTEVAKPAEILFRFEADVDGTGVETISLTSDGVLRVGALERRVEVVRNEYFFEQQASLRVVFIDGAKGLRGVLFTEPTSEGEDAPNRYRLFLKEPGQLHVAFDRVLGEYGVTELVFSGKGDARYVEDPWTACMRAGHPVETALQEVTLRLDATDRLVEVGRTKTKARQKCKELSG